jgi:hypothetical protein
MCEGSHLDEKAICSDARLAELDRLIAAAFLQAKRKDPKQATKDARQRLEGRAVCGNDRVCLLDSMTYVEGITTPAWIPIYRKQLIKDVLKDDLSMRSYSVVGKRSTFPTSAKGVQATLVEIDGVDTDHALAKGKTTDADLLEYCERDPGGYTSQYGGRLTVAQCTRNREVRAEAGTFTSRANCRAKNVTLWDGTWRFLKYENGITWTNPKDEVEEPWNGTAAAEGHFQLLCPNTFARIRAEAEERSKGRGDSK